MLKNLTAFLLGACLLSSAAASRADLLFTDEFNDDILNRQWQVKNVPGVDMLLTKQPGKLYINNEGAETSVENANAASLAVAAPKGDFTIETHVTEINPNCFQGLGPTLFISFKGRDTVALTFVADGKSLSVLNTQTGEREQIEGYKETPLFMRIRRVANNCIFEYKQNTANDWDAVKQKVIDDTPVKVGLMFPANAPCGNGLKYTTALGYFHLEGNQPDYSPNPTPQNAAAITPNYQAAPSVPSDTGTVGTTPEKDIVPRNIHLNDQMNVVVDGSRVTVELNGRRIEFGQDQPEVRNGRILVPMRAIFNALGAVVWLHDNNRAISGSRGSILVDMEIGSSVAKLNDKKVLLDAPAQNNYRNRALVPLRFVAQAFGVRVSIKMRQ